MYVVFRGSSNFRDIILNSFTQTTSVSEDNDFLHVHGGMWLSLKSILPDVCKFLISKGGLFDQVFLTGHSLGGAQAMIAHFGIHNLKTCDKIPGIDKLRKTKITVITFGAPLAFALADADHEDDFWRILQPINDNAFHYVNDRDIVPRLLGPRRGSWETFFDEGNCWKSTVATGTGAMFVGAAFGPFGILAAAGAAGMYVRSRAEAYGGKAYMAAAQCAAESCGVIIDQIDGHSSKRFRAVGTTIHFKDGYQTKIAANSERHEFVLCVPNGEDAYAASIKDHKMKHYLRMLSGQTS